MRPGGRFGQPLVLVHAVLLHQSRAVIDHVIERPVQEDVVVGSARLQDRLNARDVGMHRAEVVPQRIGAE